MPSQDTALIPLRAKDGSVRAYAIIDAADAAWLNQWRWHLTADGYAARNASVSEGRAILRMHRVILGLATGDGLEGDHIDRDTLNNRRRNLRVLSHNANKQNRRAFVGASAHRGVIWNKQKGKWQARVKSNGVMQHFGFFADESAAAEAARLGRVRLMPYAVD